MTFWDAGEFIASAHALGIPHPPGTPLFVMLARVWSMVLGWVPFALATNVFSAACTAVAGGVLAWVVASGTGWRLAAVAAALCAGATSSLWSNATETEVYAAALLLAALLLGVAWRAGMKRDGRWLAVLAYGFGLAVPLHLSALVAAPAAILLAASAPGGTIRWRDALTLGAALLLAAGIGLASVMVIGAGVLTAAAALVVAEPRRRAATFGIVALAVLGTSASAFLLLRAAHDPALNAGNPADWSSLWWVVARRQYAVAPMWPRRAPLWLQLGNLFEYADWQFALGLSPGVAPSWMRTPVTLAYAALGVYGAHVHRSRDRRSWRAFALLIACASLDLVAYLNFRPGPSYAYGVIADDALREARERDYFFVFAFWVWGCWAGLGAVALGARHGRQLAVAGAIVAAAPIALNWRAMDRGREPEASLARDVAHALLWSAPPGAVLVAGGDNDSYPLQYAQVVEGLRPDVTVVTVPLLGASWYRAQLARRDSLLDREHVTGPWRGERDQLLDIGRRAAALGRPVAVALSAGSGPRELVGDRPTLRGAVVVRGSGGVWVPVLGVSADTVALASFVARFGARASEMLVEKLVRASIDAAPRQMRRVLACPVLALAAARTAVVSDSLESSCNFR